MKFKSAVLAVMAIVVALGSGCVSSGTYQAKEQESLQLSKSLEESKGTISEMTDKNAKLSTESEALAGKLKKLDGEFSALKEESGKLKDENSKLKDESSKLKEENARLAEAAKPENLLKSLADSLATLQNENSKLKLSLENVEKTVKKNSEPLRITPEIAKPEIAQPAAVEDKKVGEKPVSISKDEPLMPAPAASEQKAPVTTPKPE